jgi:two-component system, NtrC family, response regulator AtoC
MAKILTVDDEFYILDLLKIFLEEKGHTVVAESGGLKVLEKVKTEKPSVVLLDVNLPGKSGLSILKDLKELDPELPVIMITGVGDDEVGRACLKLGAFDYITKPIDFDYLERVLWAQLTLLSLDSEN